MPTTWPLYNQLAKNPHGFEHGWKWDWFRFNYGSGMRKTHNTPRCNDYDYPNRTWVIVIPLEKPDESHS